MGHNEFQKHSTKEQLMGHYKFQEYSQHMLIGHKFQGHSKQDLLLGYNKFQGKSCELLLGNNIFKEDCQSDNTKPKVTKSNPVIVIGQNIF